MPIEIVRITALPPLATVTDETIIPVVDHQVGGTTRKITADQLKSYVTVVASPPDHLTSGSSVLQLFSNGNVAVPGNIEGPGTNVTLVATTGTNPASWIFDADGNLTVPGSIIPLNTSTCDIGSPEAPFRHIYASTGSIYLGTAKLSMGVDNSLNISVAGSTGTSTWTFSPDGNLYSSNATDLNTVFYTSNVENVLYVSKSGSDVNNGKTLGSSFLTIKAALAVATSGTTIFVKSGDYVEANPVTVPAYVAVVGDSLRTVSVTPGDLESDLFYVNNGCYLAHMTFKDHIAPHAAVAFNPDNSAGVIVHSPYVQNCTSMTTTGTGMRVDGSHAQGLRSMVCDAYTQYNQGGIGIHLLNKGYAQLVSVFTICCDVGFLAESGGRCSITNSNSSFGNIALEADGISEVLYTAQVQNTFAGRSSFTVYNLSQVPNIGDALAFVNGNANFYTVSTVSNITGVSPNIACDITTEETVRTTTNANTVINFYQNSVITAAGHTFEWIGAGTDINTCLPTLGGVPIPANQAVQSAGGKVFYTGTDQKGNFRIGSGLTINNNLGTISGRTFTKSLFGIMTPYILAIGR
jgi:hypothetical protein